MIFKMLTFIFLSFSAYASVTDDIHSAQIKLDKCFIENKDPVLASDFIKLGGGHIPDISKDKAFGKRMEKEYVRLYLFCSEEMFVYSHHSMKFLSLISKGDTVTKEDYDKRMLSSYYYKFYNQLIYKK